MKPRIVFTGLLPSIEDIYAKSKTGSPQRTLLERRIMALELAVQAIDEISQKIYHLLIKSIYQQMVFILPQIGVMYDIHPRSVSPTIERMPASPQ